MINKLGTLFNLLGSFGIGLAVGLQGLQTPNSLTDILPEEWLLIFVSFVFLFLGLFLRSRDRGDKKQKLLTLEQDIVLHDGEIEALNEKIDELTSERTILKKFFSELTPEDEIVENTINRLRK